MDKRTMPRYGDQNRHLSIRTRTRTRLDLPFIYILGSWMKT